MNVTMYLSISLGTPAPHLELAAGRGQHFVFFPKLTQKHVSIIVWYQQTRTCNFLSLSLWKTLHTDFAEDGGFFTQDQRKLKYNRFIQHLSPLQLWVLCYPASLRYRSYFKYLYKLKEEDIFILLAILSPFILLWTLDHYASSQRVHVL